jgi:hypothetical protein
MRYLSDIPKPDDLPPGQVVVHNHATPTRELGTTAFRAWLADKTNTLNIEPCDRNWAPELRGHYRERGL